MKTGRLESEVEALTNRTIPMHMPGHKRLLCPSGKLPYDLDITEISGADDLHNADGILRRAMERASSLWGSGRTWFLVGGSTCGILAGIRAAVPFHGEIIAARNCHRSVYHAIELGGIKAHWIIPAQNRRLGICREVTAGQVRDSIRKHPNSAAVILTSPTYEGVVSDIREIAKVCRSAGIPLLVDEAHGAHFGLFEEGGFPDSAVHCGADLVVQSAHKTLPALTQTALLHLQSECISEAEVERQLGIFETSSPSYPLMISLDSCVQLLTERGPRLFGQWKERLDLFYEETQMLRAVKVWNPEQSERGRNSRILRDRSKIVISFKDMGMTGAQAAQILRRRYGIETEMSSGSYVLAMTGCGDSGENLRELAKALESMDAEAAALRENDNIQTNAAPVIPDAGAACRILTAVTSPTEEVCAQEAEGRICGEYLYAYPPGIPILAPGEWIGKEHLAWIRETEKCGNPVLHTHAGTPGRIVCLSE